MEIHTKWNEGFPKKTGWYDCLYEGVECRMLLSYCAQKRQYKWIMPDKTQLFSGVKWRGEANQYG